MTHPVASAIEVENLVKRYPRRRSLRELMCRENRRYTEALSGLSFRVQPGELVGLLGPNGAGKTTLLKTLSGLILPDEGRAIVRGLPTSSMHLSKHLGLANGEERSFYWRLTAGENLDFFARLHGLTGKSRRDRVKALIVEMELGNQVDRRFGDLSAGMRQRLAIARGLLADPEVLLMDEPTRSLDPVHVDHLTTLIKSRLHADMGKSILLATHDLQVAERVCDRILVLQNGQIQLDGTASELRQRGMADRIYLLRLRGILPASLGGAEVLVVEAVTSGEMDVKLRLPADMPLHMLLQAMREGDVEVMDCSREDGGIEHGFMTVVCAEAGSRP